MHCEVTREYSNVRRVGELDYDGLISLSDAGRL